MSFVQITKELLNQTITENGDKAFVSTLSPCLDYFALCGGKRFYLKDCASLFVKAFMEDKKTALKLLFYTRDIKNGLGERRVFRFLFSSLCLSYPKIAKKVIPYVPEYGRYDDLLATLLTPVEDVTIELISKQLKEDMENKAQGKSISLLAKWLPSINTSNQEARFYARYLCEKLNLSKADYRKTLSYLRKDMLVENDMRIKKYDFDYAKVPSMAMKKYGVAFSRNDRERYTEYLSQVQKGEKKMNVQVLDLVSYLRALRKALNVDRNYDEREDYFETTWNEVVRQGGEIDQRVLVVRDGSASMTWSRNNNICPLDIADAMALYTSERLTGEFHNKFITFSESPELVDLSSLKTIKDKYIQLKNYDDCTNTDIEKVYQLILDVYQSPNFKSEDALDKVLIVSDMEFDMATQGTYFSPRKELRSTFENFKEAFDKLGYKMPEIVFWNVESRASRVPVLENEFGVKLVSGSSKNVVDLVVNNESMNPLDFMNKVLLRYQFIDELFEKDL